MSYSQPRRDYTQRDGAGPGGGGGYNGKRMRKSIQRRTVDYNHTVARWLMIQPYVKNKRDLPFLRPDPNFIIDLLPPSIYANNPMNAWTPEGRRLVTGSSSGEFTLWNGLTFNFETILQAHDTAVRAMRWSHNDDWMVTADHNGYIKYWQSNMNPLKVIQGHKEAIRDLSFSPSDARFATCSDDSSIKIWNFHEGIEERTLTGHGWDVKCVDWHPQKSLLASGSKDNLVKLWDPKTGKTLTTLHGHKNTILGLQWNRNGNWLATGARDQLIKVYDIRMMRDLQTFRGHKKEVCSVAWHPQHESLMATGGSEGSIMFWTMGQSEPAGLMENAHDSNVWSLDWHPVGHILVSGSNDHTTRFWTRNRPGESMQDKFNVGIQKAAEMGLTDTGAAQDDDMDFVPGLGNYNHPNSGLNAAGGFDMSSVTGIPGLGDTGAGSRGPMGGGIGTGGAGIPGLDSGSGMLPGLGMASGNQGRLPPPPPGMGMSMMDGPGRAPPPPMGGMSGGGPGGWQNSHGGAPPSGGNAGGGGGGWQNPGQQGYHQDQNRRPHYQQQGDMWNGGDRGRGGFGHDRRGRGGGPGRGRGRGGGGGGDYHGHQGHHQQDRWNHRQ
ncbi:hypothetical protein BGW42_007193 [Actinomortierella wolfii]|nr:hypothetical protein BGW42_007193 [Actinomortierella wolfii]